MKRFAYILLSILTALSALLPGAAIADTSELDAITTPHIILYEAESGTVLYQRAAKEKAYPASTTKIMTCLVALECFNDLSTTYTCGYEATNGFGPQSSVLGLQNGYVMTVKDMLYGLMLVSGNDCAACLAVASCGSIDAFVDKMNQKAAEIGMNNTHYVNAHGLHNEEHYTTAYDMALLMSYALKNDDFKQIIKTTEYTVNEVNGKFSKTINTSNRLLYTKENNENVEYQYTIGGKTGETNAAGFTLVEAAEKNGVTLVVVLMGDDNQGGTTTYYRFRNAVKLFDWGFENYVCYDADDFNTGSEPVASKINLNNKFNIQTKDYDENDAGRGLVEAAADISQIVVAGVKDELGEISDSSFAWAEPVLDPEAVTAPVKKGDKLGTVSLYLNGEFLMDCDLISSGDVAAKRSVVIGNTDAPGATGIVNGTSGPSKDKVCNLTVSKNGGDDKYTVWVYYDNTLCTMEGGTCYYLFYDGEVFRSSTAPAEKTVTLYRIVEAEDGALYYVPNAEAEDGGRYIVSCGGIALKAAKSGRSLAAQKLEFDENGNLISAFTSDIIWTFTKKDSSGYQLTSNGRYLHRSPGDGLLFWIIIGVVAITVAILVRLLLIKKTRRRGGARRRSGYRIYRS